MAKAIAEFEEDLTRYKSAVWMSGYFAGAGSAFLVSLLVIVAICLQ